MMSANGDGFSIAPADSSSGNAPRDDPPKKNLKRRASTEVWVDKCPYCREYPYHPVKTSCGHVFCYGCLKGAGSKLCGTCRQEFDQSVFTKKQQINVFEAVDPNYSDAPSQNGQVLVQEPDFDEMDDDVDIKPDVSMLQAQMAAAAAAAASDGQPAPVVAAPKPMVAKRNAKFVWLYKCRFSHEPNSVQKWWRFNGRIELDMEKAYQEGEPSCRVFVANKFYTIDFAAKLQRHDVYASANRAIERVEAANFKDFDVIGCEGIETPDVWDVQE